MWRGNENFIDLVLADVWKHLRRRLKADSLEQYSKHGLEITTRENVENDGRWKCSQRRQKIDYYLLCHRGIVLSLA